MKFYWDLILRLLLKLRNEACLVNQHIDKVFKLDLLGLNFNKTD